MFFQPVSSYKIHFKILLISIWLLFHLFIHPTKCRGKDTQVAIESFAMRFVFLNESNAAHRKKKNSSDTNGNIGIPATTAAARKDEGYRMQDGWWLVGGDTYLPQPLKSCPSSTALSVWMPSMLAISAPCEWKSWLSLSHSLGGGGGDCFPTQWTTLDGECHSWIFPSFAHVRVCVCAFWPRQKLAKKINEWTEETRSQPRMFMWFSICNLYFSLNESYTLDGHSVWQGKYNFLWKFYCTSRHLRRNYVPEIT